MLSFKHIILAALVALATASPTGRESHQDAAEYILLYARPPPKRQVPAPTQQILCPDMNNTLVFALSSPSDASSSDGHAIKPFRISCDLDHAGGDLPDQPVYVSSLAHCISACAQTAACVDFTLSGAACYLKGSVGPTVYGTGAQGARLVSVGELQAGGVYVSGGLAA